MTDTDKILQALERLEAGQQTMQKDITSLQTNVKTLQTDVKGLQTDVKTLQARQAALQTDVKALKEGQETLELKVEAFHTEQAQANTGIISTLHEIGEVNAQAAEKRFTRIEKHLNLPPVK